MRVLVAGTGMAAMGAAIALSEARVSFDLVCPADRPNSTQEIQADLLRAKPIADWTPEDRTWNQRRNLFSPAKTLFGGGTFLSDYFPVSETSRKVHAPYSRALGGMASAWGAAALPLDYSDMELWSSNYNIALKESYEAILANVPYSFAEDELSDWYPTFGARPDAFRGGLPEELFLSKLKKISRDDKVVKVGRARLMLDTSVDGCKYCGACMSGCVFQAIFNPGRTVLDICRSLGGRIFLGSELATVAVGDDFTRATIRNRSGSEFREDYNLIILAVGPFESARILYEAGLIDEPVSIGTRNGILAAGLDLSSLSPSARRHDSDSKVRVQKRNTLAAGFIEIGPGKFGMKVHVQVSPHNELVSDHWLVTSLKKVPLVGRVLSRLFDGLRIYQASFSEPRSEYTYDPKLRKVTFREGERIWIYYWKIFLYLSVVMLKTGQIPLPFFIRNSGSYHVGNSRYSVKSDLRLESPQERSAILVVDSSVLPQLPHATLGLTISANSHRIVSKRFQ